MITLAVAPERVAEPLGHAATWLSGLVPSR